MSDTESGERGILHIIISIAILILLIGTIVVFFALGEMVMSGAGAAGGH